MPEVKKIYQKIGEDYVEIPLGATSDVSYQAYDGVKPTVGSAEEAALLATIPEGGFVTFATTSE